MDQVKIGKFIAQCRKNVNLTQLQLAEKLNITNRAVSKWETGKALPDSSIMLALCDVLQISVNELLKGEKCMMENGNRELEQTILDLVKQKEDSDRRMLALEWVIGILSSLILLAPVLVAAFVPMEEWLRIVVAFSGFIPGIIGLCFAIKIEQVSGYYACKHCNHRYVPTYSAVSFAPHLGRTRWMRCPACGKKSWQKKVLTRE